MTTQRINKAVADQGIVVAADVSDAALARVLAPGALTLVAVLHRALGPRRARLLTQREVEAERIARGGALGFLAETERVRADPSWSVRPPPADLQRRVVEITGPVVPAKMVINALNSDADTFMADFEDSVTPSWDNILAGHHNLVQAARGTLTAQHGEKKYVLKTHGHRRPVLLMRPRGWHLLEKHVYVDGMPVSASLFDLGVYLFHNASVLLAKGSGPYFYLPKLQSYHEARLWNDAFLLAQQHLGLAVGTIRATVLIETIHAAFQMEEILYELRDHSTGLNCGRWDYLFSYIKTFLRDATKVLPNRDQVGMTAPFMAAYVRLLIATCHRRKAHAIGGMAATIPSARDARANEAALAKVQADKQREAQAGHDGTWVAHPGLIATARAAFEAVLRGQANQLARPTPPSGVTPAALVTAPTQGTVTLDGVRENVRVILLYLSAWLSGLGCVPLHGKMEDLATAEISRLQLNQWIVQGVRTAPPHAKTVTVDLVAELIDTCVREIEQRSLALVPMSWVSRAAQMLHTYIRQDEPDQFMSLAAYDAILSVDPHILANARLHPRL